MPASRGNLKVSKEDYGTQTMPPGPYPYCRQAGHWRVGCLDRVGHHPKLLFYRKVSEIFWAWQSKTDTALGPLPPAKPPRPREPKVTV